MATTRICSVDGCGKIAKARGLCNGHWLRWRRHGDPTAGGTATGAPAEFLERAVAHTGDECLLWPFVMRNGYGAINLRGGPEYVHRLVCERAHGAGRDLHVAHSCGNRACCNPKHLRWATRSENEADKLSHGRDTRGERAGTAKLSEVDIATIRQLLPHHTQREIAGMFGISRQEVSKIKLGARWAWLP